MKTYKLYLIRHGSTSANERGVYCGATDVPLSENGIAELDSLLDTYDYPYVEQVYSSPLSRATETARLLYPASDIVTVDDLRETSFGEFEGKTLDELKGDPNFQKWAAPAGEYLPKDAENPKDFFNRSCLAAVAITEQMMRSGITSAAVVTHAGVIANILAGLAYPRMSPFDWRARFGCGWCVSADPSLFLREPVFEVISEVPDSGQDDGDDRLYNYGDDPGEFDTDSEIL